jgi:isoquinoline 1-oxidoreductase
MTEQSSRGESRAGQSGRPGQPTPREADAPLISDWLQIEADGLVLVYTGKAEVGQHIRTSLAQSVAEELRVPFESIRVIMGDTDRTPFDMGTFGSRTTPYMAPHLRKVAAATREVLLDLAAARWNVDRGALVAAGGAISHPPSDRRAGYGELTQGQPLAQEYPDDVPLTPAAEWTVAGSELRSVDSRAAVTGARQFTPDIVRPGMLAGAVLRAPSYGATRTALDVSAAAALPGVTVVHEGDFVGVVAPTRRQARAALRSIRASWDEPGGIAAGELAEYLHAHPATPEQDARYQGFRSDGRGSLEAGRAVAAQTLEASYSVAYIAHAPLEPRAALAEWSDGRLTVWTGTQRPFGVRTELAAAFEMPEQAVRVIVPDTGGGYGGKHSGEAALEAARLARAVGRPVKLIWTREEEFCWAYLRPGGVIDIRSAAQADGTLTAWEYHNYNSGAAAILAPYEIANQQHHFHLTMAPLRQGSYRALAATANTFARETHLDELAHLLGMDPLELRLHNLRDARLRDVLQAAADAFGWRRYQRGPGRGAGIACGVEKGSYVATCAEVEIEASTGAVRVLRVVQAYECGAIINPHGLRGQVEGAIIQGLGGALFEAIDFADGKLRTSGFSSYRVPRVADIPPIEVVLLNRPDLPSAGAGETPIIGIAPALGNAIFAATGERRRSMPLEQRDGS